MEKTTHFLLFNTSLLANKKLIRVFTYPNNNRPFGGMKLFDLVGHNHGMRAKYKLLT